MTFNNDGSFNSPASIAVTWDPGGGAAAGQTFNIDLTESTDLEVTELVLEPENVLV